MKTLLAFVVAVLFCTCLKAVDIDCDFSGKLPAGLSMSGTVQQENGVSVMVNDSKYVVGILGFTGEEGAGGILTLAIATTGDVPSKLGIILYQKEKGGKLNRLATPAWLKTIPKDEYTEMTFTVKEGTFKADANYEFYFYRANQKGVLKVKHLSFKTIAPAK